MMVACAWRVVMEKPHTADRCGIGTVRFLWRSLLWPPLLSISLTAKKTASDRYRFLPRKGWVEWRAWLKCDQHSGVVFCEWCSCFERNEHRNRFVKICCSMKLESVKKYKQLRQHEDSEAAQQWVLDLCPNGIGQVGHGEKWSKTIKTPFQHCFVPCAREPPVLWFSCPVAASSFE